MPVLHTFSVFLCHFAVAKLVTSNKGLNCAQKSKAYLYLKLARSPDQVSSGCLDNHGNVLDMKLDTLK